MTLTEHGKFGQTARNNLLSCVSSCDGESAQNKIVGYPRE